MAFAANDKMIVEVDVQCATAIRNVARYVYVALAGLGIAARMIVREDNNRRSDIKCNLEDRTRRSNATVERSVGNNTIMNELAVGVEEQCVEDFDRRKSDAVGQKVDDLFVCHWQRQGLQPCAQAMIECGIERPKVAEDLILV
jgi:hypothetical protein